jgi:hypothetical protein
MEEYGLDELDILNENKKLNSDAAREFANVAAGAIVEPHEIDINPNTGQLKRGARTQRVGYLFSGLADMLQGGAKHQEKTINTLLPYSKSEVSSSGIDTMAYDPKSGLFVPADLKADNTTPLTHISDEQKEYIPGLPQLSSKLSKIIERGSLSDSQKANARKQTEEIGKKAKPNIERAFQHGILNLSPDLNWVITPGQSTKPFHFPGLVTRVSPEILRSYAQTTAEPSLSLRPGKTRVEWKVRGREPSVQDVAQQIMKHGAVSTSTEDIHGALTSLISPGLMRQLNPILHRYLSRTR